jgi:hypothetical protein
MKIKAFWYIASCSLVKFLMIEAVSISEKSVNFYETTRCIIPEGCHLQQTNSMEQSPLEADNTLS